MLPSGRKVHDTRISDNEATILPEGNLKETLTKIAKKYRFGLIIYSGDRRNNFVFYTKFGGVDEPEFENDRVR